MRAKALPLCVSTPLHDRSYKVTRRKNSSRTASGSRANGHTNGHSGAIEAAAGAVDISASEGLAAHFHRAGSDDSAAGFAAGSATSAGARANCDAYAELAQADPAESACAEGKWLRPPGAASRAASRGTGDHDSEMNEQRASHAGRSGSGSSARSSRDPKSESAFSQTPAGTEPLPLDGATFVEAVHERVDLIALEEQLLRSADEKIVQRELAYLRELRYGKTASFVTDDELPPRIVFDPPDPIQP
jgi:hypothetical protein